MTYKVSKPDSEFIKCKPKHKKLKKILEESFNFIFCDSNACKGCCEYLITVMPLEITNARATISNGRMAALVQEGY